LDCNNALHTFLDTDCQYSRNLVLACGLVSIPNRRIFDRGLKTISTDFKQKISKMGYLFVTEEGMADPSSITTIAVLWWKQRVVFGTNLPWKKGIVWCLGIDTDARWGYSHTKGWILDINYI